MTPIIPRRYRMHLLMVCILLTAGALIAFSQKENNSTFISYKVNPKKQHLKLFYKNRRQRFGSIQNLKDYVEHNNNVLDFAMNGGMYKKDGSPQGLYIEAGKTLFPVDTVTNAHGNFYLQPNGIYYISNKNVAGITTTKNFKNKGISYATQSGPMLVIDGVLHTAFKEGSANLQLRNGVGILPNGDAVFAISKEPVNFYDFAQYFKNMGCKNALYLDGFVSRAYIPSQNLLQTDGDFGVIIGVTNDNLLLPQ